MQWFRWRGNRSIHQRSHSLCKFSEDRFPIFVFLNPIEMEQRDLEVLLKELQSLPKESEWVEFKANNGNPRELGEYLSALSNGARIHNKPFGYLIFGVEDSTHRLVGTNFRPSLEKKGNQELENWLSTLLEPRVDLSIFEFEYDNLSFCIFRIDAANNIPVKFQGKAYIRIGSYKKPLSEHPEKERKIWDNEHKRPFEKIIALDHVTEDEILRIIDYPSYFEMMQIPLPDNRNGIIEKLCQEKIIEPIEGELYNITNLGALLFGRRLSDFETIVRKATRVIVYKENDKTETKKEQLGPEVMLLDLPVL